MPITTIAAFDFDGTLTNRDSFWLFLHECISPPKFRRAVFRSMSRLTASVFLPPLRSTAKEKLIGQCLAGVAVADMIPQLRQFTLKALPKVLNVVAIERLRFHLTKGHTVLIVSASPSFWILPWAQKNGVERCICTELEVVGGLFTGRFSTPNCNGPEKVRRFLEEYPLRAEYTLFYYGDSSGDREMLELADRPFYRRFS